MSYSSAASAAARHVSQASPMSLSASGSHEPRSHLRSPTVSRSPLGTSRGTSSTNPSSADEWAVTGRPQHADGIDETPRTVRHTGQPKATSRSASDIAASVQPWLPFVDSARRLIRAARQPRPARAELAPHPALFPASIMRRVIVRRRRAFAFVSLDTGRVRIEHVVESIPCELPTSADDRGLPPEGRWTPPRQTRDFDRLPYREDFAVRMFVRDNPEGASLQEIADEIGFTKQGVNEVLTRAVRKLIAQARIDYRTRRWMAEVLDIEIEEIEVMLCRV